MLRRYSRRLGVRGASAILVLGVFFVFVIGEAFPGQDPDLLLPVEVPPRDGTKRADGSVVNGVILLLLNDRWHRSIFLRHSLPSLERYFLSCHPQRYPIHVFHEGIDEERRAKIRSLVPSALRVDFEDVSWHWKSLPHNISEAQLGEWVTAMPGSRGRGYRLACRFWTRIAWTLPSMDKYDYFWRLDTDSMLAGQLLVDPLQAVADKQCEFGFSRTDYEEPPKTFQLWETFSTWASTRLTPSLRSRVAAHVLTEGKYNGLMYTSNFQLGTFRHKRSAIYRSLTWHIDEEPPHGILRFRWRDATIDTFAVLSEVGGHEDRICEFNQTLVPYLHGYGKTPVVPRGSDCNITEAV